VKKRGFKEIYYWITFLARSFVFASFAKIIEFNTLLNYLDVQEGEKVCDLGSGYGSNNVLLSLAGAQTYAVDIDIETLKLAKRTAARLKVKINYCTGDLNNSLSFRSQSLDKALSCCVLEHLSNPETFLSEVNRILRPKGTLAISVDSFSYRNITDQLRVVHKGMCAVKRYYTKREAELLLKRCGFSVEKCSFIIKSPISSVLFETLLRTYFRSELYRQSGPLKLFKLFTPVVLVVCMMSDHFYDDSNGGYWLTLLAVKKT
jgi:ubiquinone/menaquinone biosynthesis C-methylase UbiE